MMIRLSVLDDVFKEEYERLKRMRAVMVKERDELPKGYLSSKLINGKAYYYLQHRCGKKVVSSYIKMGDTNQYKNQIARRKQLDASIKEIDQNMKKLEKVLQ